MGSGRQDLQVWINSLEPGHERADALVEGHLGILAELELVQFYLRKSIPSPTQLTTKNHPNQQHTLSNNHVDPKLPGEEERSASLLCP
jgi:hypothetical protein